jgi:hypothetical protein
LAAIEFLPSNAATEPLPSSSPAPPGTAANRRPTAIVQTNRKQIQTNNSSNLNPCQRPTDKTSHNNATKKTTKNQIIPIQIQTNINLRGQLPHLPPPPQRGCVSFPTMGTTRRKRANDRVVGTWLMCSLVIIILLITILNVDIIYHFPPTMAIKTCAASSKNKPAGRALNATTATPMEQHKERRTARLPKSP